MDFKKKAGLALALAAIFTTGGANVALAAPDNLTESNPGLVTGDVDNNITTQDGQSALLDVDAMSGAVTDVAGVKTMTLTGTSKALTATGAGATLILDATDPADKIENLVVNGVDLVIGGDGGGLITSNGETLPTLTTDSSITIGDATSAAKSAASGGSLNEVVMSGTGKVLEQLGGTLVIKELTMTGNTLYIDPAWYEGTDIPINAAKSAILDIDVITATGMNSIAGDLLVAQNSQLAIGTTDTDWLYTITQDAGRDEDGKIVDKNYAWADQKVTGGINNGYTAAFGLFEAIELVTGGTNGIVINGDGSTLSNSYDATADSVTFADRSLFAVNVDGLKGKTAISSSSTPDTKVIDVVIGDTIGTDQGTGLYLYGGANGGKYNLISDIDTITVGGAALTLAMDSEAANLADFNLKNTGGKHWFIDTSSDLLTGKLFITNDSTDTAYIIGAEMERSGVKVQDAYSSLSSGMAGMVEQLYNYKVTAGDNYRNLYYDEVTGQNTYDKPGAVAGGAAAGIAFVSRLTDNAFMKDHEEAAAVLEGAAQIAVAGGVPYLTGNVMTKVSSLIVDHNNILNATQPAYGNEPGQLGIWVTPFYGMSDVDGMDAGRFQTGTELSYGGAAFGIDYNINESFRLGVALNLGGGSSDSEDNGDFSKTDNDFDFFGGSIYGSYSNGAFGLTGDIGYTGVDNEITQDLPDINMGGRLHSDVDSDAFTVGLTGKYRFAAGENLNIAPHLGLRYTKISTDGTDVKLDNGQRIFDVDTEDQNLFQIPLGVEFSSNIVTDGGWTLTPKADLGVLFTTGDTDVDTRTRITGTSFTGTTNADVVDSAAFTGKLGITAAADNGLSLGLDYGILASGNQTDHQFTGMLRFEF